MTSVCPASNGEQAFARVGCHRVHRVLEKSLKVLEFGEKNSRLLKVLEKSLNLNVPYFEKFCI